MTVSGKPRKMRQDLYVRIVFGQASCQHAVHALRGERNGYDHALVNACPTAACLLWCRRLQSYGVLA